MVHRQRDRCARGQAGSVRHRRAALRGDLGLANGALEELRNHYPDAAQQTEATLRRQDGVLWRVYEHVFAPPPPAPVRPATATNRWLAFAAAFVILRLVAGLASWHDRPEANRAPPTKAKASTELLVFALPRIQLLAKESAPRLRAPAERALSAARKGDCTSVRSALSEMEQISATTPDLFSSLVLRKQLGDEIERARLELGNLCE